MINTMSAPPVGAGTCRQASCKQTLRLYLFVDEEFVLVVQLGVLDGVAALSLDEARYAVLVRLQDLRQDDWLQVRRSLVSALQWKQL